MLCFAADCNHRWSKNSCSFFRFPTNKQKHALWKKMSRRSDREPGPNDRLCSCHFLNNNKSCKPSIFCYNERKRFQYTSPEKKRKLNKSANENNAADNNEIIDNNTKACSCNTASLKAEIYFLKKENEELKKIVERQRFFPFSVISENDKYVLMYTGLPNTAVFKTILSYIERLEFSYMFGWKVDTISLEDQLFIALQKLRQNYTFADLAIRYNVSDTTIRNIFYTFISVIHESMFESIIEASEVPSLNKLKQAMATEEFQNCRFLMDSTEIYIENPRADLEAQRQTYSYYKKRQTFKALLAVAPNGTICFASKLYPGSISDKELFKESGIIKILKPGDLILADKGFLIYDLLPKGVTLNVPPFLFNKQFTKQEARFTTKIARKRIHVERAFGRIKNFEILNLIPHQFMAQASIIFQVCAVLVNLQNPLIKP